MTEQRPTGSRTQEHIELTETYAAHNYHPLPVVLASGEGAWVTDVDGQAVPRLPRRLLRAQLRPQPPAPGRPARTEQLGHADADQPGVLQRPARARSRRRSPS